MLVCLPLVAPIGLSPLYIPALCGSELVLVVSTEPLDDLSCLTGPGSAVPETGCCPCRSPGASTCTLRVHARFADSSTDLLSAGVRICRIIFLTGASNNHNGSFPFVLSFASFCTLHHFRRAQSALPCYPPLVFPFPPAHFPLGSPCSSFHAVTGARGTRCCGEGEGEWEWEGEGGSLRPVPSFSLRGRVRSVVVRVGVAVALASRLELP